MIPISNFIGCMTKVIEPCNKKHFINNALKQKIDNNSLIIIVQRSFFDNTHRTQANYNCDGLS